MVTEIFTKQFDINLTKEATLKKHKNNWVDIVLYYISVVKQINNIYLKVQSLYRAISDGDYGTTKLMTGI